MTIIASFYVPCSTLGITRPSRFDRYADYLHFTAYCTSALTRKGVSLS